MFRILVMNSMSNKVFTVKSPIIPRVGDQIPVSYIPFPKVQNVTLNVDSQENVLVKAMRTTLVDLPEDEGRAWIERLSTGDEASIIHAIVVVS